MNRSLPSCYLSLDSQRCDRGMLEYLDEISKLGLQLAAVENKLSVIGIALADALIS